MGKRTFLAVFLIALSMLSARAAEPGFAAKPVEVRERPVDSAKATGRLAKKQPLQIVAREGSWVRINADTTGGWVRLLDVRFDPPAAKASPLTRAKGGKDNGIRGFSEEQLLAGSPGRSEVDKLKKYAVAGKDATVYARSAGLKARKLDYLDAEDYLSIDKLPDDFFNE